MEDVQTPKAAPGSADLQMPTLDELLEITFPERQHLLSPWLREHESSMVYAPAGVGKSLFALSAALAVAGGGEFLGWNPDAKADGDGWRVLLVDGEMHIGDIQERVRLLLDAVPGIDRAKVGGNLRFLARQQQHPDANFPLITSEEGKQFIQQEVVDGKFDLLILDNFSTLGRVVDENAASSFDDIQDFLLRLKVEHVATMLVHHAGKGGDFRGSSKLAATFETIAKLEKPREEIEHGEAQFRVRWDKVRAGGRERRVRQVVAKLTSEERQGKQVAVWMYEAEGLERLYEIKEALEASQLINQKEIADLCGVSKPMARKYLDRGVVVGVWTRAEVSRWFLKGKLRRRLKQTEPPIRPSLDWMEDDQELSAEDL